MDIVSALSTLLGLGIGVWKAHDKQGLSSEHVGVFKAFLDASTALAGTGKDKPAVGQHFVLVVSAFGEALKRHWYNDPHYAPGSGWYAWVKSDSFARDRMSQIERRMLIAAPRVQEIGDRSAEEDLAAISSLTGDPVSTPYYRKLWGIFVDEDLRRPGEEELILPNRRLQFERHFRLAYREGLASGQGEPIRRYLVALDEGRAERVREILISDMAGWGDRHAFWSAEGQDGLPDMPLRGIYVEPGAGSDDHAVEPVLGLLRKMIQTHPVTIVRADFGYGKSLTARMLAFYAAQAYLGQPSPSPELWRPVFVRCASDFHSSGDDLEKVLLRAQWRHAHGLGLDLSVNDKAFAPPAPMERTLVLVDGLDEVTFGDREVKELFRQMRERASERLRFVVFTRPAALGRSDGLSGIPILDLMPFRIRDADGKPGAQVDEWLARWRSLTGRPASPTAAELDARHLLDIAKTPILLYMIADSWQMHSGARPSLGDVYEGWFRHIARGKHEADRDRNRPIAEASQELRDRLVELEHLPPSADPPEAMLWLMSRVAWKMKCLDDALWLKQHGEQRGPFEAYHVRQIVREELGLDNDEPIARTIQLGLLLALQANPEEGTGRLLFGHKSFRDFLVARYWAWRLREKVLRNEDRGWELDSKEPLLGGRLLGGDDESYRFLRSFIAKLGEKERAQLARWAQRCFDDERAMDGATRIRNDRRPLLREAALAIAAAAGTEGLVAKDERTLLSLLAWFWVQQVDVVLRAPGLRSPKALLCAADMRGAFLRGADLSGAHLSGADLGGAVLCGARLPRANLHDANLRRADLRCADLRGAALGEADLRVADLRRADLRGADLSGADLRGANLRRAELLGANFEGADCEDSQLAEGNYR
jgi:hypothetical protein